MTGEQIAHAMAAADAEARRLALVAIAETLPDDAAEHLLGGLGDPDWRVRKEAARATAVVAVRLGMVPALIGAIAQGENVGLRNAALEVVETLGEAAEAALVAAVPASIGPSRKFLVEALGGARGAGAISVLAEASEDADPNVAAAALEALARAGGPIAERALRKRLTSTDAFQRLAALDGLNRLAAVVPWPELEPLLTDRLVRRVALLSLGRSGSSEAIAPLLEALAEPSAHVVDTALLALGQLTKHDAPLATLIGARLASADERVRSAVRRGLADGKANEVRIAATRAALLSRDLEALRGVVTLIVEDALPREVLSELSAWGEHAALPLLTLSEQSAGAARSVALELAVDLATVDGPLAARLRLALRAALLDATPLVAAAAARGLARFGTEDDVPALIELAGAAPEILARACAQSLSTLASRIPATVDAAMGDSRLTEHGASALVGVVAALGGPHALERLRSALSSDEVSTRRAALDALARLPTHAAAELAAMALADEDVDVQTAAAAALGNMRDEPARGVAVESLLLVLVSGSPRVQAAAARALGALGDGGAVEPLRDLARSRAPGVAVAALEALRNLREPTLDELLVESLGHPDTEVVKQALLSIHEHGGPRAVSRLAVALAHSQWDVRRLAAVLLGGLGTPESRATLAAHRTTETDDLVRTALDAALAGSGGGRP
jgi:HEAT repeat protein